MLTSVATHHPNLDFTTICNGYADGLSMEDIQMIGESLLPHARSVAEQVSAQWVMDVRHETWLEACLERTLPSLRMARSLGRKWTSSRHQVSQMWSHWGLSSPRLRRSYRQQMPPSHPISL